jgi:tryptophan synthase alpha chain
MNRISSRFESLRKEKKKAFIPYVTFGDPDMRSSVDIVRTLAASGADIIELGIPFSDPMADGPTIQRAIFRSLKNGATVKGIFGAVKKLRREIETPFVFMTYYNIVFTYGLEKFVRDAKTCGADGIIVPDLPLEEAADLIEAADREDFAVILLASPTTPPDRFREIATASRGFIYYVSVLGVTGAKSLVMEELERDMRRWKKLTDKPICVGFGVATPEQAGDIAGAADGVIFGSAIINVLEKNYPGGRGRAVKALSRFVSGLAKAVHSAG